MKVAFCTPTVICPYPDWLEAMKASAPLIQGAGWETEMFFEIGNAYISGARATLLRKALDAKADVIVFLDHDLSWRPQDLLRLIECSAPVAAGTYRFKNPAKEEYMGKFFHQGPQKAPIFREDGCIKAYMVPAGFLKLTRHAVCRFMTAYPELCYGEACAPHVDLFNHGAERGVWWGEDYAFCRRWLACGGDIWLIPDLEIDHHGFITEQPEDVQVPHRWPGNFLDWMKRQASGGLDVPPLTTMPVAAAEGRLLDAAA